MQRNIIEHTQFKAHEYMDGTAWYVRVSFPGGQVRTVERFSNEGQAKAWIANDAAAWLARVDGGLHKNQG